MSARRIAIILPDLRIGGAERVSITLAEELIAQGFAVDLVLLQANGSLLETAPPAARIIDLDVKRLRTSIAALRRYFKAEAPVAAFANIWPLTLTATIAARLASAGTKVVTLHQNSLGSQYVDRQLHSPRMMKAALRLELALARKVVGCSDGVIGDLARLAGAPVDRFGAIANPVKINKVTDAGEIEEANSSWGVPKGRRILAVGNLKPQKNYPLLLDAYASMTKGDSDRLVIVGEGGLRDQLEAQILKLGLDPWVVMPGQSQCLEAWYQTADLFVMSSRHEGLPTVMIEALGFGLPVVSTDCPSGPREILDNGRFGTLVPMDDPAALARAMKEALAGPVDRAALMSRADDFAPGTVSRKFLGLIEDGAA